MSDLNPLAFKVAIQDEATKKLDDIESAFDRLKDKTITVKVEGLSDLQQLLSALQHQQVKDIGKNVGSAINEATKNLQKEAQDAIRTSLGNLAKDLVSIKESIQHDNFTAFSKRIEKCAESMNTLNDAFERFHVTIGKDEGMRNFMTGLGEVIRNVRQTMGMINGGMNNATITPDAMSRSVKVAQHETERLNNDLVRSQRIIETFGDKGFNVAALERYKTALIDVRENLKLIERNGGVHPANGLTASQYLSSEDASRVISLLKTELSYYNNISRELERITHLRSSLAQILAANPSTSYSGDINHAIAGLDLREGLLARQGARDAVQTLNSEAYRTQIQEAVGLISKVSAESRKSEKDTSHLVESMRRAGIAVSDLAAKFDKLEIAKIRANAVDAKVDTSAYDKAVERMERYRRVLEYIAKNGGHDADRITKSVGYRNASNDLNIQAAALKTLTREATQAATSTQQLSMEQQRLAQALETSTSKLHNQSQILSDLKSLAMQYLGVWGGQQFLNNIIQIGGQLEMQRLSIGAILQNQAQANELFNRIKALATQSPFGVVELDQMTKQLTAYGFKYNELFDMTKRLADISAATGTGVDRLALALGHVRSEAALSGYTLRQFAMGNVPLLQKLSEKLGKSTEEIRKMVRAKQISYDDVVGVLKDLTDEGGMFHNMQEVISQSVKAKFKNVKDAMDIMYGEMAEGDIGDALKEVAEVLMEVTKNWKDAATVLGTGTAMWALHRVAVVANIAVLGEHNAATLRNIAAFRAQEAQQLRTAAMYRTLTAAEKSQIATSKLVTSSERARLIVGMSLTMEQRRRMALARQQHVMDLALALSSKKLTTEDIARQVALGHLSKAQARQILSLADLTAAERAAGIAAVNNTTRFGYMRMAFITAGDAALRLGRTLKALVFNPATMMMAGVTAAMELWQHNKQEMETAAEIADSIRERANSAMQSTKAVMESSQMEFVDSNGEKVSTRDLDFQSIAKIKAKMTVEFDRDEAQQLIDEWANYIRQYSATPNKILNDVFFDGDKMRTLEEQFKKIGEYMGEIVKAQYGLHDVSDMFENAANATDSGWFNDSIVTNIMDYEKAVKGYNNAFTELYRNHGSGVDKIVRSVEKQNDAFANAVSGMNTYAEKFKYLVENWDKFPGAYKIARDESFGVDNDLNSWLYDSHYAFDEKSEKNWSKSNLDEDLETFFSHIEAELNNKGQKIGELSKAQQQDLLLGFTDFLSKTKVTSDEVLDYLKKRFSERFKLELDADSEKFKVKVNEVMRLLKELSESEWNVEMKFGSNVKDVIDEARKQYKAAKEYFENVKPIMLKLGVDFEMGKELTEEQINEAVAKADPQARDFVRQALQGVNEATRIYNQAMTASKHGGFDLEEKKKKTGGGSKAYKDEFAKRWDERIRIMKEAYSWYDKWEKKVGNDAAIAETNSKYEDIFKEWRTDKVLPMDFDVRQIADYQKYVEKIRDDALARYQKQKNDKSKKNGEEALRVYRQAVALLNDIKFDNFIKAGEQFKALIDQTIEDLNTRWDIYNTVRSATGNESLAFDVAGISGSERNVRNSADALKEELKRQFSSLGGMAPLLEIDFDAQKDAESVRKMFEDIVPADARDKIDGLIEGFKEWQKLQKQVVKSDISSYTKLLGLVTDYDAQVQKINDRLKQQKEANANLVNTGKITSEQGAEADKIAETQADWEKMQLSAQYANLYNNAIAMSREEFDAATKAVERMIERLKELGLLSPEKAVQEQQKLQKARNEYGTTGFLGEKGAVGQFISGGYEGLMGYYAKRRDKAQETANRSENGSQEQKDAQQEAEHYGKLFQNMSKLSDSAKDVVTAFSTLQSGLDLVTNLFDSMGNEGVANAVGDAAGVLGGAMQGAQSLSALGPWGMAAGAGLGLVSGLFAVHDKALQREIERLREDVQKIENNTSLILQARERTLGFDTGDLRRSYMDQYAPDQNRANALQKYGWLLPSYLRQGFNSEAQRAMYEYYKTNSTGTGYQQQYQNLLKERQDYMDMYNAEQDKKKSSGEALEEYRKKIAELDDEIRYFTLDLAKQLFDIDIKGWADQLSDALSSAFENGESAAKAYKDTVTNILQQVMNKMMQVAILEPMFQSLQDKLFGNSEKNIKGVFDASNPQKSMNAVIATITSFFGKGGEGEQTVTAALEFMNAFERGLNNAGLSVLNSDTANTLSSGVQGTSEETSALLAGYVNALRQDVAIKRILMNQFVTELWPEYVEQVASIVTSLKGIDNNVALIRALLSENGAIYVMIDSMKSHLDNITNGNEQVSVK